MSFDNIGLVGTISAMENVVLNCMGVHHIYWLVAYFVSPFVAICYHIPFAVVMVVMVDGLRTTWAPPHCAGAWMLLLNGESVSSVLYQLPGIEYAHPILSNIGGRNK